VSAIQQSVDDFLRTVLRSGLLDREQLQGALRAVPLDQRGDPGAVAEHLVRTGKLSRFQAAKLREGTALGLKLGSYQVLAPIGRGGMGTVYLARDSRGDMLLALKVLSPKRAREEERVLERFRREMEISQRVAHPNLAWTYEVGVWQGVYYIAMEYIPGKSLYRLVGEEGPLAVPRAARLVAEVASALDHAHDQGLVHRDLKPSNVMVTPNDHAKVLDLGLALIQGEAPGDRRVVGGQGYVVGTMDYIAPEQADDATKVDRRSDLYALGGTLYFALTGRPPFPGGTTQEKLHRHRTQEPTPVEELRPGLPADFLALVRRLMAKRPEDRFATAAEVKAELEKWVSGEPVRPMDQRGDSGYRHAVAALEEAAPDGADTMAPILLPDAAGRSAPRILAGHLPPVPRTPGWVWALIGFLGAGIVAMLVVIYVLWTA
jgi:serine/threonine protein kinase